MSNTFIPFNFAPKAHVILSTGGTTTYTILANEFALVTVHANLADTAGNVTLDGTSFFKSGYIIGVSGSHATATNSGAIGGYSDGYGKIQYGRQLSAGVFFDGPTGNEEFPLGPTSYEISNAGANTMMWRGYAIRGQHQDAPTMLWAKAGNVIAISGGDLKVVIHRYDLPS